MAGFCQLFDSNGATATDWLTGARNTPTYSVSSNRAKLVIIDSADPRNLRTRCVHVLVGSVRLPEQVCVSVSVCVYGRDSEKVYERTSERERERG